MQGSRNSGSKAAEGCGNLLKNIVTDYACFCSTTMLTSKIITEII